MVSVGAGESTFFAQTLKGTRESVSFSPARTAALTPSSLHLRGRAWSSFVWGGRVPEDHVNYSEAELAFVHRAEGKDSGWAWGCFCSVPGGCGLFGFPGLALLAQVLRGDDHALPSAPRMFTGL